MKRLSRNGIASLLALLKEQGFQIIGPVIKEGAIHYETIATLADLPAGFDDDQSPGQYRLKARANDLLFAYTPGPTSWKKYLFLPREKLFSLRQTADGFAMAVPEFRGQPVVFFSIRPCELAAIEIQDNVFLNGKHVDQPYKERREQIFTVVVECLHPAATCFCAGQNSGPELSKKASFDLALTELGADCLAIRSGSKRGEEIIAKLSLPDLSAEEEASRRSQLKQAAARMQRSLPENVKESLQKNPEHPRWTEVAERCLSCANCTMVCPTCFCYAVEDLTSLNGQTAERHRRWDSCFTGEHSYIHGGHARNSTRSRYRQWLTHKLAGWVDQFGESGCTGCGRCIAWCPAGIDLTEEARAIAGEA